MGHPGLRQYKYYGILNYNDQLVVEPECGGVRGMLDQALGPSGKLSFSLTLRYCMVHIFPLTHLLPSIELYSTSCSYQEEAQLRGFPSTNVEMMALVN